MSGSGSGSDRRGEGIGAKATTSRLPDIATSARDGFIGRIAVSELKRVARDIVPLPLPRLLETAWPRARCVHGSHEDFVMTKRPPLPGQPKAKASSRNSPRGKRRT
jgi:hypothetical protein